MGYKAPEGFIKDLDQRSQSEGKDENGTVGAEESDMDLDEDEETMKHSLGEMIDTALLNRVLQDERIYNVTLLEWGHVRNQTVPIDFTPRRELVKQIIT